MPYLVTFVNVGSMIGRTLSGLLADRVGPLSVMTPFTALAGTFALIWPFVHGNGPVVTISILYGYVPSLRGYHA